MEKANAIHNPRFTIKSHDPLLVPLTLPTPPNYSPSSNSPIFNDAMRVRIQVFCDEQNCSLNEEMDADDIRSWQWVVYASPASPIETFSSIPLSSTTTTTTTTTRMASGGLDTNDRNNREREEVPVACIRLVPPPHPPHETLLSPEQAREDKFPKYDVSHEPYVKITRVAVLKDYRGFGLSRLLMDTVHRWLERHGHEAVEKEYQRELRVYLNGKEDSIYLVKWNGLCLVHAQVQVEKMYERFGYETNPELGVWDEEGIDHVGMFRRLDMKTSQWIPENRGSQLGM